MNLTAVFLEARRDDQGSKVGGFLELKPWFIVHRFPAYGAYF
jgi:hypothetical protein